MINNELLPYLAGCLDCDGYFGIKRSTYHLRVRGDATQPVFSERVGFTQIKPEVVKLLKATFGGGYGIQKAQNERSHPCYKWWVTDKQAAECAKSVLPYLRVKHEQASLLLRLRELKRQPRIQSGTFIMTNRWGFPVTMPRRIVDPAIIQEKECLFNQIKALNDIRPTHPRLI